MTRETFHFAGFAWPRTLPRADAEMGAAAMRKRLGKPRVCGPYYTRPVPLERLPARKRGLSFYLESDFAARLRWRWADEVEESGIRHKGWWCDDDGCGETMRGIVLRLPHGRGFLAGWSMGEGMASDILCEVHAEERRAARAADALAMEAAQLERDYQEGACKGREAAEADAASAEAREEALGLLADLRRARAALAGRLAGDDAAAGDRLCAALRARALALVDTWREERERRDDIRREWRGADGFDDGFGEAV